MKKRELINLGIPRGVALDLVVKAIPRLVRTGLAKQDIRRCLAELVGKPGAFLADPHLGELAAVLAASVAVQVPFVGRSEPAPCHLWGEGLESSSLAQINNARQLPVTVACALMPDAHTGYGLPIGGVLATRNAVVPYAVGMDIACRMKLSILDIPISAIRGEEGRLRKALGEETCFGVGGGFRKRRSHAVLDADWSVSPVTWKHKDKAWQQLGSSGSGNHFVEFGTLTLEQDDLGLSAGKHFALLSHSGSRGTGGEVAKYYSRMAMDQHPELPRELIHLAWLDLDSDLGQEYWAAMELMGQYAAANHELIHHHVARALRARVLAGFENHHNYAWRENHFGEDVIVHRKGATPAGKGVIGIIPGSMATPGYICKGKGQPLSMNSAAHGAGRAMSRKKARASFTWSEARKFLKERDVVLISAGLDEVPMSYKDIEVVMAAQQDLVEVIARFDPRLVKMDA